MDKAIYECNLIERIIASIENHGGRNCLSSIILTGSFGRGEPTYIIDKDGNLQLKSDVEIALVYPISSQKLMIEQLIREVSWEFKEELNLMTINERRVRKAYNFNFSFRTPEYKTIFTYDLYNGSKTIWGKDFIGKSKVALEEVDIYEAKRLVANRIGELVYIQNITDTDNKIYIRQQWKGKLILAIASAWLICEGEYVSSYCGQYTKIKNEIDNIEDDIGLGFFEEYQKIFNFLRKSGETYEMADDLLIGYVKNIDDYFRRKNIKKPKVNSGSRIIKYVIKYVKSGMEYGGIGFEDKILQSLISDFRNKSERLIEDADVWHKVLY